MPSRTQPPHWFSWILTLSCHTAALQSETIQFRNAIAGNQLGGIQLEQDMDELGGLQKYTPKPKGTFVWLINDEAESAVRAHSAFAMPLISQAELLSVSPLSRHLVGDRLCGWDN